MKLTIWLLVKTRGIWYLATGRPIHRSGLTNPCRGCSNRDPHDSHLAPGSLAYLRGGRR